MSRRGNVLLVLAVIVLACGGLWGFMRVSAVEDLRSIGEVTAVVDGDQSGTVVVGVLRRNRTSSWLVDDAGQAFHWIDENNGVSGEPKGSQCLGDECYRVAGTALRVEHSADGGATFAVAWEVSGSAYTRLEATYPDLGDPTEHLSSLSLVVHAVPGGHVVFVADGRDGLLYRDVGGGWHRLGVPDSGEGCCFFIAPVRLGGFGPADLAVPVGVVVAVAILLAGRVGAPVRRGWWRRRELPFVVTMAALGGAGAGMIVPLGAVGMFPGVMYSVPMVLGILVGGIVLVRRFVNGSAPFADVVRAPAAPRPMER